MVHRQLVAGQIKLFRRLGRAFKEHLVRHIGRGADGHFDLIAGHTCNWRAKIGNVPRKFGIEKANVVHLRCNRGMPDRHMSEHCRHFGGGRRSSRAPNAGWRSCRTPAGGRRLPRAGRPSRCGTASRYRTPNAWRRCSPRTDGAGRRPSYAARSRSDRTRGPWPRGRSLRSRNESRRCHAVEGCWYVRRRFRLRSCRGGWLVWRLRHWYLPLTV